MVQGVKIHTKVAPAAQAEILTEDALKFLAALHRTFETTRQSLLVAREDAQRRYDSGVQLDFPSETAHIRAEPSWHCAPPAPGLEDRRVEITGPTDRKMVINALNSGAKTFMADFEGVFSLAQSFTPGVAKAARGSARQRERRSGGLNTYGMLTRVLSPRFERAHVCEHDQWAGESARRCPPPGRL